MSGGSAPTVTATTVSPSKIDISEAISSILKSAEILVPALQSAGITLGGTLGQSNALLAGYGDVANNATTQMQRLLGMTPVDLQGKQLQQQVQNLRGNFLGSDMSKDPTLRSLFSDVDSNLASAIGMTDPTQRQAAYERTLASFNKLNDTLTASTPGTPGKVTTADIDALRNDEFISREKANMIAAKFGDGSLSFSARSAPFKGMTNGLTGYDKNGILTGGSINQALGNNQIGGASPISGVEGGGAVRTSQFIDWFKTQKGYTGAQSTTSGGTAGSEPGQNNFQIAAQVQDMMQQFQYNYDVNGAKAVTSEDITTQVQNSPEYKASYDSGMQAIERAAAAGGMLSSGNTLRAASDFGTQLSGTVYGNLYSRLAGLQSQTVPVAQQAASNQMQNAGSTYNAAIAPQQARSSALLGVGNLQGQTSNNQAQLNQQAAIANQQAKLQADLGNQQAAQSSGSGLGSIAGALTGGLLKKFGF